MKCKTKREMQDPIAMFNAKGSPVTVGVCTVCGTKLYRMGRTDAHQGLTPPEKPVKVEKRDGKWVSMETHIKSEQEGTQTLMQVNELTSKAALPDNDFTEQALAGG